MQNRKRTILYIVAAIAIIFTSIPLYMISKDSFKIHKDLKKEADYILNLYGTPIVTLVNGKAGLIVYERGKIIQEKIMITDTEGRWYNPKQGLIPVSNNTSLNTEFYVYKVGEQYILLSKTIGDKAYSLKKYNDKLDINETHFRGYENEIYSYSLMTYTEKEFPTEIMKNDTEKIKIKI